MCVEGRKKTCAIPRHGENLGKSTLGSSFHVFLGEVFMLC